MASESTAGTRGASSSRASSRGATPGTGGSPRTAARLERRAPGELEPHPRNARLHSEEQLLELRASIRRFGFVRPLVANEAGVVLAGHGARLAAIAEGLAEVPVIVVSGLTDEEERAYVIADNRLAEKSKWDWAALAGEFAALEGLVPLADMGFAEWAGPGGDGAGAKEIDPKSLDGEHRCPRCGFEWTDP